MRHYILLLTALLLGIYTENCMAQQPGDLDNTFGTGGLAIRPNTIWTDIAMQADGKVVAAGGILVARYKTDGTLDSSFGNTGIDTVDIGYAFEINAVAIQPDGKILAVGRATIGSEDFLILRLNSDGSPDNSFDGDGIVTTDLDQGSGDHGYDLAVQQDGKIVVAGASGQKLALVRYNSDGSIDNTFDLDGTIILTNINVNLSKNWFRASYIKLQDDEKILAGSVDVLTRLHPDGSIDNNFGSGGRIVFSVPMNEVAIQPDGKIVAAGDDFAVARLDTNGVLDNSFGTGGITIVDGYNSNCSHPGHRAMSVVLQPDGRILAAGYNWCCLLNNCRQFVLIRFNPDGSVDSSFSSDGKVITDFPQFSSESHACALTPDLKKVVLAGFSYELDYGGLARYHLGPLLDVETLEEESNLIIAPNPTQDLVSIKATDIENGIWNIQVTDQTGRLLLQEQTIASGRSLHKQLSLQSFASGIYFLKLTGPSQQMTFKVVR